ncbi:CRISPR-associated protein Cmr3 [Clostridium botulinum]|uniref:CRISPR-associated protein Cmr3 n=1 Tax=Clostridium botulinum C/D str. DC5 TaxID=1443128 RepID=A0A0A0IAM2_CLOBO|nr:type III-B CRISPR module-associated Cmr3 family protein [Clostridium botulinum]KGM98504.1 hypothetical protein Z955_11435 [Clostridium botulinum C/D str. DC5]KOC51835.1 hypothetical protein ADU89_12720 [Clostridium botulinum]KOC53605.1 hypothetical protein ADU90_13395 [Clostridium botulinum]MCD3234874.1 CRISPR-associated protein Cmr3 [Clostridium botulinum D/C]MCD3240773.1 CRISPR-associated protein Cmr3 [Clostridium botulinum D/C]
MSNKYLVKLRPMGSFFFGSERTFGLGEDNEHYIIQSECFPQQTSILGMLRKEILVIKKLIRNDWNYSKTRDKVDKLIGKKSFNINLKEKQNFGVIEKVHPVFIRKENKYLMSIPKDHKMQDVGEEVNKKYTPYKFCEKRKCTVSFENKKEKEVYIPYDYEAKVGLAGGFIDKDKNVINFDDVFKEDKQIGIRLKKNKQTSEDELYKIIRYRLKNNCEFVFNLDINFDEYFKEVDLNGYSNIVSLGGEASYFKISFQKVDEYIVDNFKNISSSHKKDIYRKIILLSNTYISKEQYDQYCNYGIINGITFRNLKTDYSEFEVKVKGKYYKKFKKTDKYMFLERGSVLFSKCEYEKLKHQIEGNSNIKDIGYNKYI